jgi:hypothetical protein
MSPECAANAARKTAGAVKCEKARSENRKNRAKNRRGSALDFNRRAVAAAISLHGI